MADFNFPSQNLRLPSEGAFLTERALSFLCLLFR